MMDGEGKGGKEGKSLKGKIKRKILSLKKRRTWTGTDKRECNHSFEDAGRKKEQGRQIDITNNKISVI